MMSGIRISDDGSTVVFVRGDGAEPRRAGRANPSADPNGPEHAIWAARTARRAARGASSKRPTRNWRRTAASMLFVKDGQIYPREGHAACSRPREVDRGEKPFITEWGVQSAPKWSPDGRKIAFVSTRTDHSFIVVYDMATRTVKYMSPSVDFDTKPMWLPTASTSCSCGGRACRSGSRRSRAAAASGCRTGRRFRRAAAASGRGGRGGGGGRPAAARQAALRQRPGAAAAAVVNNSPGLMRATFKGGYTLAFWKADVTTGDAQEIWHNQPNDPHGRRNVANVRLAGDYVIFPFDAGGGAAAAADAVARRRARRPRQRRRRRPWTNGIATTRSTSSTRRQPAGAADDDRRPDRGPDVGRGLGRRQDVLLLHERQGHRAAPHLGGAGRRAARRCRSRPATGIETYPAPLASGK